MKNLQSFGVQELSAKEISETQGGGNPFADWLKEKLIDTAWDYFASGQAKEDFITSANVAAGGHSYGTGRGFY